jgi:hypothetical protein
MSNINKIHRRSETLTIPDRSILGLYLGRLVFNLSRLAEPDTVGIIEGDSPRINELALAFDYATAARFISSRPVSLRPGDWLLLGRAHGALIYDAQSGEVDEDRTSELVDRVLLRAIEADNALSRLHAKVTIEPGYAVTIEDRSTNGTGFLVRPQPQD